jgi:2-keto-4-pentenoate hydratase/2-oxohepta-3-ene-1,7-dioic acid hydratase in catechol pathway
MRLATVQLVDRVAYGAVEADGMLADLSSEAPSLRQALGAWGVAGLRARVEDAPRVPLASARWLPVVPDPSQIFCVGLNYEEHRRESGRDATAYPTIFVRFASSLTGHECPVLRSPVSDHYDYEGELAVVIVEDALDHVAGLCPFNDVSVRDFQRHTTQFTAGKNFPTSGPFGPWLTTLDEVGQLGALELETRVNGTSVQHATVDQMIFGVAEIISYVSQFTALVSGDVIATGTPSGVGGAKSPPVFLHDGDVIEVEISGLGILRNTVVDEVRAEGAPR